MYHVSYLSNNYSQQEFPDTNELIIVEMKKNKVWLSNEKCENIWLFLKMTVWSEVYNAHKNNTCTWNCKRQPYSEKGGVKGGRGGTALQKQDYIFTFVRWP